MNQDDEILSIFDRPELFTLISAIHVLCALYECGMMLNTDDFQRGYMALSLVTIGVAYLLASEFKGKDKRSSHRRYCILLIGMFLGGVVNFYGLDASPLAWLHF